MSGPASRITDMDSGFEAPMYLKQRTSAHTVALRAGIRISLTQRPGGIPENMETGLHERRTSSSFQNAGASSRAEYARSSTLPANVTKIPPASSGERSSGRKLMRGRSDTGRASDQ